MSAPAPPTGKAVPRLLIVVAVALLLLLAWRAYSPQFFARPTEQVRAAPIDVNAADRAAWLQVPGVGPHMADAILAERERLGRFETLDQLDRVHGIGPKTLDKLRPWLSISPGNGRPLLNEPVERLERKPAAPTPPSSTSKIQDGTINVNTASAEELVKLPGIGAKMAERVISERAKAPFKTLEDLRRVSGIGPKTLEKLKSLVRFAD